MAEVKKIGRIRGYDEITGENVLNEVVCVFVFFKQETAYELGL